MGISVIISHFSPAGSEEVCRGILKKTIASIRRQQADFEVEIVLCDDGSQWSTKHLRQKVMFGGILDVESDAMKNLPWLCDLAVDRYLYINSGNSYWAIRIKDIAFRTAKHNKIIVLDDDHPLKGRRALSRYHEYLEEYDFVRGRVVGPTGIPQVFRSRNVQGTNYGLRKNLYIHSGGYGRYLFEDALGEDDDIFYCVYKELIKVRNEGKKKRAAYAGEIVTKDYLSGRYLAPNTGKVMEQTNIAVQSRDLGNQYFAERFFKTYGIAPGENPARDKRQWMEFGSLSSFMTEIYYLPIYHVRMIPVRLQRKMMRVRRFMEYCKTNEGRAVLKGRIRDFVLK